MKNLILNIDGERVQVWAQVLGQELWLHFNGKTFIQDLSEGSKRRSKSGSGGAATDIVAPMPGKILSIKVKKSDALKKGDLILVMEAMKMEYSLKAPADCVVKEVLCNDSDQVNLKQKLVDLDFEAQS